MMPRIIEFAIQQGDILDFEADVLGLKFAQGFYGTDQRVILALSGTGIIENVEQLALEVDAYRCIETKGAIRPRYALFVGVPDLSQLFYAQVRRLATRVLEAMCQELNGATHLAMALHGVNSNVHPLHETASFLALFAGYLSAFRAGHVPAGLAGISIVVQKPETAQLLRDVLEQRVAGEGYATRSATGASYSLLLDALPAPHDDPAKRNGSSISNTG